MARNLPSNANLNDYYTEAHTGIWYIGSNASMSNCPDSYGTLIVTNNGCQSQIILRTYRIYWRLRTGNPQTWGSWYKYELSQQSY